MKRYYRQTKTLPNSFLFHSHLLLPSTFLLFPQYSYYITRLLLHIYWDGVGDSDGGGGGLVGREE